ncbi:metalloreductase STEAP4 [Aplysia californica]|uniref:Metalloreductase STEAP4 n=1 Tax=Aplysia californica TaxID=6500 RepID=A0ABM1VYR9_APLCA|nr:metalloreductase STEAP4 [Aplysia californica]XP_035827561.1 metalloreductase STEAP4 [Aplysia californica]XP_035827562.1 metalloreductase STEAP4 [Aplysia californica]XP_035827563.1 metalloreductase STEAP4 [Aplysia californica]XP_035827564.1 metalloreductase STEAP4 [Aplysia californica]XP_035827565.1 metalloreductase STEAP4 [Aplysia californica]
MEESLVPLMENDTKSSGTNGDRVRIGVVGTGNFAVAFTKCLVMAGYNVIMGSRRPGLRKSTLPMTEECLCGVELTTISECFTNSDVIFIAIHMEDFQDTLGKYQELTRGKILVDVSNREYRYAAHSNAEYLTSILPHAIVVKAFNSVPTQALEQLSGMGREGLKVLVASDSQSGRTAVSEIAKSLGFLVIDLGGLKSARYMEEQVLKTFTLWRIPLFLTFGIFNLWSLFIVYLYFIEKTAYNWEQIFLKVLNKPLCMTAITVLALTYLPGQLAAVLQVINGTKHKRFPRVLDTWLKSRKQLGIISYALVCVHVIASVLMLSPTYYSSWFHHATVTLPANVSHATLDAEVVLPVTRTWMTWKGEAACLVGIAAFLLMSAVALTSIPSVGESLNWSEWTCVHSKLSYFVLFLSVAHVCVMGGPGWAKAGPYKIWKSITFLSSLLPMFVLVLKILFSLPPLSGYLRKIRRGWERDSRKAQSSPCSRNHDVTVVDIEDESQKEGSRLSKLCGCAHGKGSHNYKGVKGVSFANTNCHCASERLQTKTSMF